jgi:CheY-like chemotaxis protein
MHGAVMGKRILVVEDQEDNRRILPDLLTSADFEVIEAGRRGGACRGGEAQTESTMAGLR